jgi:multidrug efflux pump subunit AcrB
VSKPDVNKGVIAWFAHNPVAANLLMLVIISFGLGAAANIQRAMFPAFETDFIMVTMPYPGAAPEEVEQGVILRIEEALSDLQGIDRIESTAQESLASVFIDARDDADVLELMNEIKNRIDGVAHFPADAEEPIISRVEPEDMALFVQIWGDLDERSMTTLAEEVKTELLALPDVSKVEIMGTRDYEIAIEVPEHKLREYHLTLGQIANIISTSSLDLPGGSVKTRNGDIMLRTQGQAYRQGEFEQLVLKTFPDGTRLTLGEIANVNDGFADTTGFAVFNGRYSVGMQVSAVGAQDVLATAHAAKKYVAEKQRLLPDGIELTIWTDITSYLDDRISMMVKNMAMGALLVFIVLALFLEIKLAFWVMVGIPICFLGVLAVFSSGWIGGSLNMMSLFGFILVLGIVVDDAIIIGESAYAEQEKSGHGVDSIVTGALKVATPATFGVLTTICAFLPTLFVEGVFSSMPAALGWVVLFCLTFSLIESKWILPAHLAHSPPVTSGILLHVDHLQAGVNKHLRYFISHIYKPLVERCIRRRYLTLSIFISSLVLTVGLVAGGYVRYAMMPDTPSEYLSVELRMADGTPQDRTVEVMVELDTTLNAVEAEYLENNSRAGGFVEHVFATGYGQVNVFMMVELTKAEDREIDTREVVDLWRRKLGDIAGAEVLAISSMDGPGSSAAISFDLIHNDFATLKLAAADLEREMRRYDGVYDIRNGASATSDEFHLDILPEGEVLGLTRYDLGTQVRHAFYGAEAQRIQRGSDEVKVMVRYPREDRESTASLDGMFIRTPAGDAIPFNSVATSEIRPGFNKTTRLDFRRAVEVTAEADKSLVEPSKVIGELSQQVMPGLMERYPGLSWKLSGLAQEEQDMVVSMLSGFGLALFGIYALLAIPTRSYLQPLIIMGVIPFGIIGAVFGHIFTGHVLSMMSFMGIIALSGVVVNDSLIMVDFINRAVREGEDTHSAVVGAGAQRFRAILLTSLTTFFGLLPMLLETTVQAQSMIPMAVSLAFGIVFATVITLLLVPCLYMMLEDLKVWRSRAMSVVVA